MHKLQTLESTKCSNCNTLVSIPKHCGKLMELHDDQWVCWKGEHDPCCGRSAVLDFDKCCENPSLLIFRVN